MVRKADNLTSADFLCDAHAARYRDQLDSHPAETTRLLEVLNEPTNEQRLLDAEHHGHPALTGVARFLERDPLLKPLLEAGAGSARFRQTVGVAVKLKMRQLGWVPTGRKGTVRNAEHFTKAEHYARASLSDTEYRRRGLAALDAVAALGDLDERTDTGDELLDNLAATRAQEGRPF